MEITIGSLALVCAFLLRMIINMNLALIKVKEKNRVMSLRTLEQENDLDILTDRFELFEHERVTETLYQAKFESEVAEQLIELGVELNQTTCWVKGHSKTIRAQGKYLTESEKMLFEELKVLQYHIKKSSGLVPALDQRVAGILLYIRSRNDYNDWLETQILIKSSEPGFDDTVLGKAINKGGQDGLQ